MKQLGKDNQQGFSLIEIVLAVALLVVISSAVVPSLLRFYRQAAVEYETEHLLADIRKAQSMSRTSAPALRMDIVGSDDRQGASLLIDRESYLVIFCEGHMDEGRRIMISRGGRIRIDRRSL